MLSLEHLALPDYEYLAQCYVLMYMEDASVKLLENNEDISQYGTARFFAEYFNSVCQGTHIPFWEFNFTPHNRASFLWASWRCFQTGGKNGPLRMPAAKYQMGTPRHESGVSSGETEVAPEKVPTNVWHLGVLQ